MKKVGYIGFGAIGATYGSQMLTEDYPIYVIVDGSRKERYQTKGVTVNGKQFLFDVITPSDQLEPLDAIFVSVKYNQLDEACELIKPFVDENTTIVSLLNGIDSEEIISTYYDESQVLHAYCVVIDALRVGQEIKYTQRGRIVFGAGFESAKPHISKIEEILKTSKVDYEIKDDILKALWWKFLVNVGINQVSAILKGSYGLFQTNENAQKLMIGSMNEVINISKAVGIGLDQGAIETFNTILATLGPDMKTSMLQDVEAKRITEVDMLAGKMMALGKQYNVPVPINEILFDMIKAIEANY